MIQPYSTRRVLGVLVLLWLAALWVPCTLAAETVAADQDRQALQQAIVDGLAAGRDVSDLLDVFRHQPVPLAPAPVPPRHTAAADLREQLVALRQALAQTAQAALSEPALTALERAYQQVQAAHMMMGAHFRSVEQQLAAAAMPGTFETRRQTTVTRYDALLGPILAPLADVMTQLRTAPDRAALVATAAFRDSLRLASQNTLTLLASHLQEPPRPILRAQTLPVRPAQFAPRPPRLAPVIQPSYLQSDPSQVAPTPADLAETPEAPFHAEILAQAQALEHDYIRIYNFVRNEIATEWYAGAMHGALGTLRHRRGNAIDQASLLIVLLRASGAPARYIHGVIRLPLEQVMASLGLTEATQATRALSAAGLAYRPVLQGGHVTAVDLESTWVAAYVPYTNYRRAVVDTSGPLWIPLMPAVKQVQVEPATQILRTMGTSVDALLTDYLAQPQSTDLRTQLEQAVTAYLLVHDQATTYAQQLGALHIVPLRLELLPTTLPVTVTAVTAEAAALDDSYRQRLRLVARQGLQDNASVLLEYTVPVSEVASERLTLSYLPASVDDQRVTNLYGGLDYVPAYLTKLRPQLKRNGRPLAVATGSLDAGTPYRFEMHLLGPAGSEQSSQTLIAGSYHALSLNAQGMIPLRVDTGEPTDTEALAAALLYRVAHDYSAQWTQAEQEFAGLVDVTVVRPWPSVAMVSNATHVDLVFGQAHQLIWQGVTLDVAVHIRTPIARSATTGTEQDWLRLSALHGSILEHQLFEQFWLVNSISADKGLQLARAQGITIHRLDALNMATLLPSLRHPQDVLDHITTSVGLGCTVDIPVEPVRYQAWQGSVWRVDDPASGASGYFIAGGLAGGATSDHPTAWALEIVRAALAAPNTAPANRDPRSAASITALAESDGQTGEVSTPLARPLAVIVHDARRRPVSGAFVTFTVIAGGGCVRACPTTTLQVPTDELGIAAVPLVLGQKTADNVRYVQRQPKDEHLTQAAVNLVDASVVNTEGRRLTIATPFTALAYPKPAVTLRFTHDGGTALTPGIKNGWLFVQAFDPYDNPVSNVPVTYTAPSAAVPPQENCPYVPTHFLGRKNEAACPFPTAPVAGECGSPQYTETTGITSVAVNFLAAQGTEHETVTVSAPGLPVLTFTYALASPCSEAEQYFLRPHLYISSTGFLIHAARVGTSSRVPVSFTLYRGSAKQGFRRVEAAGGVDAVVVSNPSPGSTGTCARPDPMRYKGEGTYETFIRTALTPGLNQVQAAVKDQDGRVVRAEFLQSVAGLRLRITGALSQHVPEGLQPDLMYLDESNRSVFDTHIQYTVAPDAYQPLSETIELFADGVSLGTLPAAPRTGGMGRVLLWRGFPFDPHKTYTAQLVLNSGSRFELRSRPVPLPLRAKLLTQATSQLRVRQDVDIVNDRSCVQSSDFTFTLNEAARVSLVFAQKGNAQATATVLDNMMFPAGQHRLPFFLPAVLPMAEPVSSYTLMPGQYAFALTAIATGAPPNPAPGDPGDATIEIPGCPTLVDPEDQDPPPSSARPNQDYATGTALIEYHSDRLPVGRTLVNDVDVASGTLTLSRTDLQVPGRGVPLAWRRTYSANSSAVPGQLGVGWGHNYQALLVENACGDVTVSSDSGTVRFTRGPNGVWQPLKGYHGTLQQDLSGTFDFSSTNGTRYHFVPQPLLGRPSFRLDFIADPNGNVTRLGYDPTETTYRKLITVEDPAGRTLVFTYEDAVFDTFGIPAPTPVITRVTAPGGQTLTFVYDQRGNLIRAAREGDTCVETYSYSDERSIVIDPTTLRAGLHGPLTSVTNANGHTTTYHYDDTVSSPVVLLLGPEAGPNPAARVVPLPSTAVTSITTPASGTTAFQYDAPQRRTTVINGRGAATTYMLHATGVVVGVQDPVGGTTTTTWDDLHRLPLSRTNARGVTTQYTYDANGNVLSEIVDGTFTTSFTYALLGGGTIKNRVASQTDRNGQVTGFLYDARGNLVQMTDAAGGVTTHTYASNGNRLSTRDPNGQVTRYAYDQYGNLATTTDALGGVTRTDWDVRSRPLTRTDALGRITTMVYDTLNRPVQRLDPLGQAHTWTYDPVGNLLTETDEAGRTTAMAYDAANRLVQRTNALDDTQTLAYDAQGNTTSETDFRGHVTTFTYDAADRLLQRTQPLRRVTTWTYDPIGNMLSETDALVRAMTFTYDALNRRLTTTDALGGVTTTAYDGEGNVLTQTDANGHTTTMAYDARHRLVQRTDPLGAMTTYEYDANGNQLAETDANTRRRTRQYDKLNRLLQRTDALGRVTTYEYDAVGNLTREINARLHATAYEYDALNRRITITDPARFATTYAYDPVGNRTAERLPNGNVVLSTYDALNRLLSRADLLADMLGPLSSYQYDADGNRIAETDANGQTTHHTYDALSQLVQQDLPADRTRIFAYDLVGNRTAETNANGETTTFAYDARNRLTTTADPLGHTVTRTYDAVGNRLSETNQRGHTTTYTYDARNRLIETLDPFVQRTRLTYDAVGNTLSETDRRGTVTTYIYDTENRLLTTRKAGVARRTLEYDAVGNLAFETDANGNTTAYLYDPRNLRVQESRPLAAITEHTYDALGDRVSTRDPEGHTTHLTYDLRRRLIEATNGAGETTRYTYDGNGNRLSRQRPAGNTWTYTYDAANRLTMVTDPLSGETQYTYDGNDNRLTQTDANGHTTSFAYDALNRLTTRHYADGAVATYAYDAAGNRIVEVDPNGQTIRHTYDALNRRSQTDYPTPLTPTGDDLQQMTYAYDGNNNLLQVVETYSGATGIRLTTRTYDVLDRLLATTDPDDQTVRSAYDPQGNRLTITAPDGHLTRSTYDALNRLTSVTTPQGVTEYAYDRASRLTRTTYPPGTTATQDYDATGRVTRMVHTHHGAPIATYVYTYDTNGNRMTQRVTQSGVEEVTTYTYDATDRMLAVVYPDVTTTYTYDAAGNRLTERTTRAADGQWAADRAYTYNTRHQVTTLKGLNVPSPDVIFTYDATGNRTQQTVGSQTTTYVYDARNQLRQLTQDDTLMGDFHYDWQGLRVRKATVSETVRYVYDRQAPLLVTDDAGIMHSRYTYGANGLLAFADVTEEPQYALPDVLGSVMALSRSDGGLQARYHYDAWGQFQAVTGQSANRLGFTGHEYDVESGLYYAKARYYDPMLGVFLSPDPVPGHPSTPPSLHPYLYAANNPTVYIDPDGRQLRLRQPESGTGPLITEETIFFGVGGIGTAGGIFVPTLRALAQAAGVGSGLIIYGMALDQAAQQGAQLAENVQRTQEVIENREGLGGQLLPQAEPAVQAQIQFEATSLVTTPPPSQVTPPLAPLPALEPTVLGDTAPPPFGTTEVAARVPGFAPPDVDTATPPFEPVQLDLGRFLSTSLTGDTSGEVPGPEKSIPSREFPHGFHTTAEFESFAAHLNTGLRQAGFEDIQAIFQGSSVTGRKFTTGQPFDVGRVSDFDIALASTELLARARAVGVPLRSGGTRTGPLSPRHLEALGVQDLAKQLSRQAGRPVNFMVFESTEAATSRAPSILVPR